MGGERHGLVAAWPIDPITPPQPSKAARIDEWSYHDDDWAMVTGVPSP